MPNIALVGAAGYGGLGMIELLMRHPEFKLKALVDTQDLGKPVSFVWPYLKGVCDMPLLDIESDEFKNTPVDALVFATPDGVGQQLAPKFIQDGKRVVDYSGDFRFNALEDFSEYARRLGRDTVHKAPALLTQSVYGLTELHRQAIKKAKVVGNPGCFAVSCILGLAPVIKCKLIEDIGIICDAKTGVSGAGKKPSAGNHYPERYDSMGAYRLSGHQHVMEIERELSLQSEKKISVTFTSQIVPLCRGIMTTLYGRLVTGATQAKVLDAYQEFYENEPFVMVTDGKTPADTGLIRGSNRCWLTVACDEATGIFRAISHIDNLMKGQSGSALQNLNAMFGYPETLGLPVAGSHP